MLAPGGTPAPLLLPRGVWGGAAPAAGIALSGGGVGKDASRPWRRGHAAGPVTGHEGRLSRLGYFLRRCLRKAAAVFSAFTHFAPFQVFCGACPRSSGAARALLWHRDTPGAAGGKLRHRGAQIPQAFGVLCSWGSAHSPRSCGHAEAAGLSVSPCRDLPQTALSLPEPRPRCTQRAGSRSEHPLQQHLWDSPSPGGPIQPVWALVLGARPSLVALPQGEGSWGQDWHPRQVSGPVPGGTPLIPTFAPVRPGAAVRVASTSCSGCVAVRHRPQGGFQLQPGSGKHLAGHLRPGGVRNGLNPGVRRRRF